MLENSDFYITISLNQLVQDEYSQPEVFDLFNRNCDIKGYFMEISSNRPGLFQLGDKFFETASFRGGNQTIDQYNNHMYKIRDSLYVAEAQNSKAYLVHFINNHFKDNFKLYLQSLLKADILCEHRIEFLKTYYTNVENFHQGYNKFNIDSYNLVADEKTYFYNLCGMECNDSLFFNDFTTGSSGSTLTSSSSSSSGSEFTQRRRYSLEGVLSSKLPRL